MLRRAGTIGMVIAAIGVAVLIGFGAVAIEGSGDFSKARLLRERNPGNAMYDLQFFVATSQLAFLASGAVAGGLLALNGLTLMLVGRLARERGPR
ncbi:hypothetical protein KF840_00220 [bacterium]|nr:hypothetical protein [bacterium]